MLKLQNNDTIRRLLQNTKTKSSKPYNIYGGFIKVTYTYSNLMLSTKLALLLSHVHLITSVFERWLSYWVQR